MDSASQSETEGSEGSRESSPYPVDDIRDDFDVALSDPSLQQQSAFSFSRSYPDAPNPGLKLADLGLVGLPLSARDADAIKSCGEQAPFGKGERTVVDKSVRDTWEMDAKKVTFINPQWEKFVAKTVVEVCQTLGVNVQASQPRAELYKLLLYETGSHFLPHVDTEKADGMFATIIIILPSPFTGGAAHLSHGSLDVVYDTSSTSALTTSVLAWYTDVTHAIKPITSGFRLALSYNLVHTTHALRPALSTNDAVVASLARVLRGWAADDTGASPEKLVYLLDHKYTEANLKASALKGADAHKVAVIAALAQTHGFRLGLANAHCHLVGSAEDNGGGYYGRRRGRGGWGRSRWYDDYSDDDDDADVDFCEIESRDMTIEHFVDLDGRLIADDLAYDEDTETIPPDLTENVESGECDEQEYEGYMGNWAGSLERWYRRTVLVVWPTRHDATLLYAGAPGFARACDALADPSADTDALVAHVLAHAGTGPQRAARAVCAVASARGDAALWARALRVCGAQAGTAVLGVDALLGGVERFGFECARPSLELMLQCDAGNASRLTFLTLFTGDPWPPRVSDAETVAALHAAAKPWALVKLQEVLSTLKKPVVADCDALLRAVRGGVGIVVLKDSILPQLLPLADEAFLQAFAAKVFADKDLPDSDAKTEVVSTLLRAAIAKAALYTPVPPRTAYGYYNPPAAPADASASAKRYLQLCLELRCAPLVAAVFERISTAGFAPAQAQECARSVLIPLVAWCAERMRARPEDRAALEAHIQELRERAVGLYLDWMAANASVVGRAEVAKAVDVTVVEGKPEVFMEKVVPRLEAMKLTDAGAKAVADELLAQRTRLVFPASYTGRTLSAVILTFAHRYATGPAPPTPQGVLDKLAWCLAVGAPALAQTVLTHLAAAEPSYFDRVLVPLLPLLRPWCAARAQPALLPPAVQAVAGAWADRVLGPRPPRDAALAQHLSAVARWACACTHCAAVRRFLTQTAGAATSLQRIGAPSRKHVEQQLALHARGLAAWEMIRTTPQGLTVKKSAALNALTNWKAAQAKGVAMLKTISTDEDELRRLLGAEYARVVGVIRGSTATRAPAAAAVPSAPAPSTSSAAVNPVPGDPMTQPLVAPPSAVPGLATASGGAQRDNLPGQPPAKRRKMIPDTQIIDLT